MQAEAAVEAGDVPVDISELGRTGQLFVGESVLQGLAFSGSELEISSRQFSLMTGVTTLDEFDNPKLEYERGLSRMRVSMRGQVEDHSPGEVVVSVTGLSLRMLDSDDQSLGTDESERLIKGLAENGVIFPEASSSEPLSVTFNFTATDEDYEEVVLTADADFFQSFKGRAQ